MPQIGVSNLVYAIMTSDSPTGTTYSAPVAVPNVVQVDVKPKTSTNTFYADDTATETATAIGEIQVDIELGDLPLSVQAALLGHSYVNGAIVRKYTDAPPYVAIGFKSLKSNQTDYRYVWLLKGKFSVPDQTQKTKADKVDFQSSKISGTFVRRQSDNAYQKLADSDDTNSVASTLTNWFTAVDQTADATAPTVSSIVPANNATAVAASSVVTWTFSEAIQASCVTAANFIVQKADGSAQVAGTLSLNAAKTVVTFTPSANLAAATEYMAIATVGVEDLFGNAMATTSVNKFTTA